MSYPHAYIKLTSEEQRELDSWLKKLAIKQNWRVRKRLRALCLSSEGWDIKRITKHIDSGERSVRRWFAVYRKKGLKGLL